MRLNSSCCGTSNGIFVVLLAVAAVTRHIEGCNNRSSAVADCLHTYLERDFPSIEAIVFPSKNNKKNTNTNKVLLLDGPELEDQCKRIVEVVECLEEIQPTCRYYHEFFPYRHLVTSLRTTINWVCHDLRNHFRKLLDSFDCLETVRQKVASEGGHCFRPHIPLNIWQRIVRLQSGTEVCKELTSQVHCMRSYFGECSKEGQSVYRDLNQIFLGSWCTPAEMARVAAATNDDRSQMSFSSPFIYISVIVVSRVSSLYTNP